MKANTWLLAGSTLLWAILGSLAVPAAAQSLQVTSANPNTAPQGSTNLIVKIAGSGFKRGQQESAFYVSGTTNPGGITVNSTSFVSSTEVDANITIASDATLSGFDIYVTSGGRTGKGWNLFSVTTNNGGGSCTNLSLQAIFAPGRMNGGTALLYGDSDGGTGANTYTNSNDPMFNGGSVYTDGVAGAYVEFQVCNGSNDFVMNLGQNHNSRFINFDFSDPLTPPDPQAVDVTGTIHQEGFLNANEVGNESLYVNGELQTCMGSSLFSIIKAETAHVMFDDPELGLTASGSGTPGCGGGVITDIADSDGPTAIIHVSHPDACTWIITPVADSQGNYVGGLVEQLKNHSYVSGGQYSMPFAIKLLKLNCP